MSKVKKLTEKYGYGPHCYTVRASNLDEIVKWMHENSVGYLHVSSGPEGFGFSLRGDSPVTIVDVVRGYRIFLPISCTFLHTNLRVLLGFVFLDHSLLNPYILIILRLLSAVCLRVLV